jgi:hypothetical protein
MAISGSSASVDFYGEKNGTTPSIQSWVASELQSQDATTTTVLYTFGFSTTGTYSDTQQFTAWHNGAQKYDASMANNQSGGKYKFYSFSAVHSRPAYGAASNYATARCRVTGIYNGDGTTDTETHNCTTPVPARAGSVLGAPTGLWGSPQSSSQINFYWNAPASSGIGPAATNYALQVSTDPGFSTSVYWKEVGNVTGIAIPGLARNTTYYARVAAQNSIGWSPYSGASAGATTSHAAPDTPPAPTISNPTTDGFTVNITPPAYGGSGITSYTVQISKDDFVSAEKTVTGVVGTSYLVTGLQAGVVYKARVLAVAGSGSSAYSPASNALQTIGGVKYWNGTSWANGIVYEWNGSSWKTALVKKWNGSSWSV